MPEGVEKPASEGKEAAMPKGVEKPASEGILALAQKEIEQSYYEAKNFHKISNRKFLDGELLRLGFDYRSDGNDNFRKTFNYIYHKNGKILDFWRDERIVIEGISGIHKSDTFVDKIFRKEVISGILALMIMLLIVYLYLRNTDAKIPDFLLQALFAIIGFYFGATLPEKRTSEAP